MTIPSLRAASVLGPRVTFARILTALTCALAVCFSAGAAGAQTPGNAASPMAFDVAIRKVGGGVLTAGQTATFTLSGFNTGPSPVDASSGVVVTDILPGNFGGPVAASGTNWNCSVAGLVVTCAYVGPLVGPRQAVAADHHHRRGWA
jgi:uncharacterized repeat protein (TIGR01451 family)